MADAQGQIPKAFNLHEVLDTLWTRLNAVECKLCSTLDSQRGSFPEPISESNKAVQITIHSRVQDVFEVLRKIEDYAQELEIEIGHPDAGGMQGQMQSKSTGTSGGTLVPGKWR